MEAFGNAIKVLIKRPSVVCFIGFVVLIFTVINYQIPVFAIIHGLSTMGEGNVFESLISVLQLVTGYFNKPGIVMAGLAGLLSLLFILSAILGFLFSGYFNIINNALNDKNKYRGEFAAGVRKYFTKIAWITFRVLLVAVFLLIYLMIASIPAAIITRTASMDKPQLLFSAAFIDILTLGVIFFSLMFFRIYVMFWYCAAINQRKRPLSSGKHIADAHFWRIVKVVLAFDVVYVVIEVLMTFVQGVLGKGAAESQSAEFAVLAVEWALETLFFSVFITYMFSLFRQLAARKNKADERA